MSKPRRGYKKVKWFFGKEIEIPAEWNVKKLTGIGKIIGGGTPSSKNEEYWNGNILWAVPTDITKLTINYINDTARTITKKGLDNSSAKLLPVNTILLTSRATIGECAITTKPMSTNQGFQNIICHDALNNAMVFKNLDVNNLTFPNCCYNCTTNCQEIPLFQKPKSHRTQLAQQAEHYILELVIIRSSPTEGNFFAA